MDEVAPDGSPIEVYLNLPAEPDLGRVRAAIPAGGSVLDLGSGVGRIANPLAAVGHHVVAVDDSAAMLAHVEGPERVLADVWTLDLGRRFDAVLALSHLVNSRSPVRRLDLFNVCRRHLLDNGVVVVQRYPPDRMPTEGVGHIGPIAVRLHDLVRLDDGFAAAITYTVGGRSWTQQFDAGIVDDNELASLASDAGLAMRDTLDVAGAWVLLGPVS